MWGAFKDHATPFQSRATSGNETFLGAPGLLNNKYIHAFMYISNRNLTQDRIMHMQGSDLTCMRCHNQECINKSENAANRATKSSNTGLGPGVQKKGLTEVLSAKKSFHL